MFTNGLDVLNPNTVIENIHLANYPSVSENAAEFREYLALEVTQGHYLRTKVGDGPQPVRTVPVAFIPKPGQPGKFRLISDASAPKFHSTNHASPMAPHFHMVSPADILARSDADTWATITDAESAFRQLPINPLQAGLLAVEFEGFYYWELRTPFGWTLAPFSWCRVTSIIQRYCALKGHNTVVFVDDFFGMAQSEVSANSSQEFLIELMLLLGLRDKPSKRRDASQVVPFVGFIFDFASQSVYISEERMIEILGLIDAITKSSRVKPKELATLVGKLVFVSQVVLGARTFIRRLYDWLKPLSNRAIKLAAPLLADLLWWSRFLRVFNGRKLLNWSNKRPMVHCCTDASDIAACGVGSLPLIWVHTWTRRQTNWHINIKELWAVYHSLLTWGSLWENHDVALAVDNSAAVAWINSGTAHSPHAMSILRKIFWLTSSLNIRLRATWIPSEMNHAADAGSRLEFPRLFSLTGVLPCDIKYSGHLPSTTFTSTFVNSSWSLSHHLQTLQLLNPNWRSWPSRVYSPRWQTRLLQPTEVRGSPSFGFSWPTSGLPCQFDKNSSCDMLPGCGLKITPMPRSELIAALCPHSTLPWVLSSPWDGLSSQPWQDVCKEFDEMSEGLEVRLISPSNSWCSSSPTSTSKVLSTWHSGPQHAWVSSPSFDPGTWFRKLKLLGNLELTSHVAMSVLLSGAQSYTFVSPKQVNLMGTTSPYLSLSSPTPTFVRSMRLTASSPVFTPRSQSPYSRTEDPFGLLIPTSDNLSEILLSNAALTRMTTVATAYEAGELRLPLPLEDPTTILSCRAYGSLMPIFDTCTFPSSSVGLCL